MNVPKPNNTPTGYIYNISKKMCFYNIVLAFHGRLTKLITGPITRIINILSCFDSASSSSLASIWEAVSPTFNRDKRFFRNWWLFRDENIRWALFITLWRRRRILYKIIELAKPTMKRNTPRTDAPEHHYWLWRDREQFRCIPTMPPMAPTPSSLS